MLRRVRLTRSLAAAAVCVLGALSAGCGERYDLGPASFSMAPGGDLRIVVCEDFSLSTVNAYVNRGAGSTELVDLGANPAVIVGAGEDVLEAVERQSEASVTRNLAALVEEADYIGIYVEGTANGVERSWTAGIRAPFTSGENVWMKPDGSVANTPC
ncbi:hypothetical protein [Microcella sp.]|uniref:hypothetical protein n=1 Tax=Microcella sp. TaxID=1913979 RepID=UPI00299F6E4B|nr:hypothetical protein [Microcella sp.]MDX2025870.1 hypothetical protein [Microcella sp.]